MNKKLKIGVLFGGKSTEHEVSVETAKIVIRALDKTKYIITPIKINKRGIFNFNNLKKYDVIFPVFHGPFGEDGTVQGLLKLLNIPFVGASVLGSAVGMDKDVTNRLLRDAGVSICKFIVCKKYNLISFNKAKKKLGVPIFIKPVNAGSSVGISKVKNQKEFTKATKLAFKYDLKIILEETIDGREIECGVIGNDKILVSVPGEIIPQHEFYTYEAKYTDSKGALYQIPAKLSKNTTKKIQKLALETYSLLSCKGLARVDFFLMKNNRVLVNEINTIPGPVMFKKLWENSGIPYTQLLDKLINLALDRFKKEQKLENSLK